MVHITPKGKADIKLDAFLNNDVVDAIEGDSFNAGFISICQRSTAEEAQVNGNLTGAVNTTAAGGTELALRSQKDSC